uniref:Fucolectin tachylectin-4 pentraxin-1 domain-containing protein n=1 Tax=Leptobrachium leishanense TaxID=445787 RepID=A0A8C5WB18_9ANUR
MSHTQSSTDSSAHGSMKLLIGLTVLGFLSLTYCCEDPAQGAINLAQNGAATQSSDVHPILGTASKAIDRNNQTNYHIGSCTHTKLEDNPWWKLDLLKSYRITQVIITNREDCCKERLQGAEIRVGDSPNVRDNPICATIMDVSSGARIPLCCKGMEGRYVGVFIPAPSSIVTLCEVEVYGQKIEPGPRVCCYLSHHWSLAIPVILLQNTFQFGIRSADLN